MFLERIVIETPDAAAALFKLQDAGKWEARYHVSVDWLESNLQTALEQGRMDSIAKQVDVNGFSDSDILAQQSSRVSDFLARQSPDISGAGVGSFGVSATRNQNTLTRPGKFHRRRRLGCGRLRYTEPRK